MINYGIQMEQLKEQMNDLDKELDKLKMSIVLKENIDLKERLSGFGNRKGEIRYLYNSDLL